MKEKNQNLVYEEKFLVSEFIIALQQMNFSYNGQLAILQNQLLEYYNEVKITKSVPKDGYVVDCIPFEQQPGLIRATEHEKNLAIELSKNARVAIIDDSYFDFKLTDCPVGDVGIVRPRLSNLYEQNEHAFSKYPKKQLGHDLYNDTGYGYIVSNELNVSTMTDVFVTLGVGPDVDVVPPYVPAGQSHSLNQLWWTTTDGGSSNTISLETGWIQSNYFTSNVTTTLFTYSTPNGYNGGKYNQYNNAGGFISYPNTPTLGTPVSNVDYMFSYQILPNNAGYLLALWPYSNYTMGKGFDLGYYPMSRYNSTPEFSFFEVGSEAYIAENAQVSMAGKIFGYADTKTDFKVFDQFHIQPAGLAYEFGYFTQEWQNASWLDEGAINFSGFN